ncbi:AAA family ATPase [Paenibacillus sp. PR3]|uniref:AAA family ATPase n=1 Tax=Paenibacillus terricola TaxID=2763503 RepID=A0ABR8MRJ7_9BACL|nr:kinase [Paenibacillus terricola]MBD3918620.1 AAA family ATPase [Paenibacillus terricola]
MVDYDKVTDSILSRHTNSRLIIGIDGLSRSGKTTFTVELGERLLRHGKAVCIFHIDDYIVERKKRYDTEFDQWYEYYNLQWDVERLREQLFSKLSQAEEISLPFYDSCLDQLGDKTVALSSDCILIVEGVFLQRAEWRDYFDFVVYLDCPREKRFERESASAKANLDKFGLRYWKAEDFYMNAIAPLANADMIISSE